MVSTHSGNDNRFGNEPESGFHAVEMPQRSDGVGKALRILCPTCHTALPDDMLALIAKLDQMTQASARD